MKQNDSARFTVAWESAWKLHGKGLDPGALALAYKVLERFELSDIEAAIGAYLGDTETGQFPPKPADIVRRIEGRQDALVELAWSDFRRATSSSRMPDDPVLQAVIRRMGGLERLGDRTSRDVDFMKDQFKALWLVHRDPSRLGTRNAVLADARGTHAITKIRPSSGPIRGDDQ